MAVRWLFLAAYACSGLAGLIYEVSWTRLLTLELGHGTAAASTVVAAFMGGLAAGAVCGGRLADRITPRESLYAYVLLESGVAVLALGLPYELLALKPLLAWSYDNGIPNALFPAIRLLSSLFVTMIPACALGATFPIAVRWFAAQSAGRGRAGGILYAVNTLGAAAGALSAGFFLIPRFGVRGTIVIGVAASAVAVLAAFAVMKSDAGTPLAQPAQSRKAKSIAPVVVVNPSPWWVAAVALAITGFAGLLLEILWTRVVSLVVGPTTYAFAATVAALITGMALGSAAGSWVAGWSRRPALWLALAMTGASLATVCASWVGGGYLPRAIAVQLAQSPNALAEVLSRATLWSAAVLAPAAVFLGAAFPLALEIAGGRTERFARRVGLVYGINTIAGLAGALVGGFIAIPMMGVERTLRGIALMLAAGSAAVMFAAPLSGRARVFAALPAVAGVMLLLVSPPWDRQLLTSGVYTYATYVQRGLDVESALTAGDLRYYKDGAAATVSVRTLTGTTSLAIDGKVDASNGGDMLTQKALAHLPLLLHPNPHSVLVIGLGSGVTLGAALVHPIDRADVVEISPEVVEASRLFAGDNGSPLADPRAHLIVGDGRSHVLLSSRQYDVIISEPSNPWIAGVASLFTSEFFRAARARLAPGGLICQWAHTYDISDGDLRSIVSTFRSVFPHGTIWLLGEGDVLMVSSGDEAAPALGNLAAGWRRAGVAADLAKVSAFEPFALWSLYIGGADEMRRYSEGAAIQTDDRMALEFSAPRALSNGGGRANANRLLALNDPQRLPPVIQQALASAGAAEWRNRGAMLFAADDYPRAYQDYARAVALEPSDDKTLAGFVGAAQAAHREQDALQLLKSASEGNAQNTRVLIAASKILAADGQSEAAVAAALQAASISPPAAAAFEQLASVYADAGDAGRLDGVLGRLRQLAPDASGTRYYAAVSEFLHGRFTEALPLANASLQETPANANAQNLVGAAYASLGRTAEARDAFRKALALNAREVTTYNNLGLLELNAGNAALAGNYFSQGLWVDPMSQQAKDGLAQARQAVNKH